MSKNKDKLPIVIIEGPSGVGKDSVYSKLIEWYPEQYIKMVSVTSRPARPGEIDGIHYKFVTTECFEKMIESGDVFEHTTRHGNYRGMSKELIDSILKRGLIPVKDVDLIGLNAIKKTYGSQVFSIFLTAPKKEIIKRLKARGDSGEDLAVRIKDYDAKIKEKKYFHTVVKNLVLDDAVKEVHTLIQNFKNKM